MDAQQARFFEDKAWNDDPMNVGSYAHLSAHHLVTTALGELRRAGVDGTDLTQGLIQSTASILWNVVTTVQEQVIGHRSLQSAVARNLQYGLDEVLALSPMPLVAVRPDGVRRLATGDEVSAWGVTAVARLGAIVSIAAGLVHQGGDVAAVAAFRGTPLTGASRPERPEQASGAYGAPRAAAQGQAPATPAGAAAASSGRAVFRAAGVAPDPDGAGDPWADAAFVF